MIGQQEIHQKNHTSLKISPISLIQKKLIFVYTAILTQAKHHVIHHPLHAFFVLMTLLLGIIIIGNRIRTPETSKDIQNPPRAVEIYTIGTVPTVSMQAEIKKAGVITLTALSGGVVSNIHITEGQVVPKGSIIVSLSTNYQGANVFGISRQIAEKQYTFTEENYPAQKDIITKQKQLTIENANNFEKLKNITNQSISETQSSIDLNTDIIKTLDANLEYLTASPSGNESLILGTKQLKSQFLGANNQLKNAIRATAYQTDSSNPPTNLSTIQKELTLKQLELQEKSLDLNREMTRLQLSISRITESLMYPSAPFAGRIERIYVKAGQAIGPGTPIAMVSGNQLKQATATIYAPKQIATHVSRIEPTKIRIGNSIVSAFPIFISSEATQGNLYTITYNIPESLYTELTDTTNVVASLPIGYADTGSTMPFVPLEAVYQTRDAAYIYLLVNGEVKQTKVALGDVYGRYIQVPSGLPKGSIVILDRSVIHGEKVIPINRNNQQ